MEIYLLLGYIPVVAYLIWQSYLLAQHRKIVDNQRDVIVHLSNANDKLKPFQVLIATLRGGNFLSAPNYNDRIK